MEKQTSRAVCEVWMGCAAEAEPWIRGAKAALAPDPLLLNPEHYEQSGYYHGSPISVSSRRSRRVPVVTLND